jgi:putative methanogenesis marker protein 7
MYETLTYTGGIHKNYEIEELIEDLGGFILQKNESQLDITLTIAIPAEDVDKVEVKAKELLGDVELSPLASTEIAVVSPTLARQHLPHAACDIAEYLRRYGTKTNMIGLARGAGKGISQISKPEKDLIEEHDLAIFSLGSFEDCIRKKTHLFEDMGLNSRSPRRHGLRAGGERLGGDAVRERVPEDVRVGLQEGASAFAVQLRVAESPEERMRLQRFVADF